MALDNILPFVLQISFFRQKRIPRILNYVDLVGPFVQPRGLPRALSRDTADLRPAGAVQSAIFQDHIMIKSLQADRLFLSGNKLLLYLWYLGTQETFVSVADRFDVALSTAFAARERMTDAFCSAQESIVSWPRSAGEIFEVSQGFHDLCSVGGIIGAIDGSHVRIRPPANDEQSHYNRKKYHIIILQGVSDATFKFRNVYIGWPGSTHNSRVLRNSPLFQSAEGDYHTFFRGNTFLIADPAYAARRWLAPTLKRSAAQTPQQRRYSSTIAKGRVVIEQAFGILKGRWRRLQNLCVDVDKVPV